MVERGEDKLQPAQGKLNTGSQGDDSSGEISSSPKPKKPFQESKQISSPKQVDQLQEKTPSLQKQSSETGAQDTPSLQAETRPVSEDEILGGFVFTGPIPSPVRPPRTRRSYRFKKKQGGNDQSPPHPNNPREAKS